MELLIVLHADGELLALPQILSEEKHTSLFWGNTYRGEEKVL
jgi:hypothetical protein